MSNLPQSKLDHYALLRNNFFLLNKLDYQCFLFLEGGGGCGAALYLNRLERVVMLIILFHSQLEENLPTYLATIGCATSSLI